MATISAATNEKIFQLKAWLGLNENPSGDTKLKMGEAAAMRNFTITRDNNLKRRDGTHTIEEMGASPVAGLWTGYVNHREEFLAACASKIWRMYDADTGEFICEPIGEINTESAVHIFGFGGNAYFINGSEYMQWDGLAYKPVSGYVPLVKTALTPQGGGETLEAVNRLTGKRRCWLSPDGKESTFPLPEQDIQSLDYVKDLATDKELGTSAYTFDVKAGTVTFKTAPAQSVNSYEVGWTVQKDFKSQVTNMRYSELYAGTQDTRVFLYGDGTNRAIYSGLDYDGKPRADYFPDLNEVRVGDENTPITAMIRHFSNLICYKTASAWQIQYGLTTLADGNVTEAFYVTPVNRAIGNVAPGQVQLVANNPRTLHGTDAYTWHNNSRYSSSLSSDERQAERISDRIHDTLSSFNLPKCVCYDDNPNQEYYICYEGKALVHNYAADAWYVYTNFDANCLCSFHDLLYLGGKDGKLRVKDEQYQSDDGAAIDAYWESGSMSFGQDYMRKYSAMLWVGIKPESNGEVWVTQQTDRKSEGAEKVVSSSIASFANSNLARWSFATNRKPQMKRLKLKAKKFVFYKLIFKSDTAGTSATILSADIRVRFTGYSK